MKKQPWLKRLIQIWCGALIIFSFSVCVTSPERPRLPWPEPPESEKVTFEPKPEGLLSFDEYRKLEGNIIELRRYIEELEEQLRFYQGEIGKDEH